MRVRSEHPAGLQHSFQRRRDVALVFLESAFTQELPARFFFDRPIAEAHQRPVTHVAQQSHPRLLFGEWFSTDVFGDEGVGPKCGAIWEIVETMRAKF